MIVRTEVDSPQQGATVGFDHFANTVSQLESMQSTAGALASSDMGSLETHGKKKWGLFGKVFSFAGNSASAYDLETLRQEVALNRGKPLPPPKTPTDATTNPGSDSDSMGSSPTYETPHYIFRFVLAFNMTGTVPPPDRNLSRPRLPAPAQSWVTSKDRSGGPSPPVAGRPDPTRAFSGSASSGLIAAAKNANPSEAPPTTHRVSVAFDRRQSFASLSAIESSGSECESPSIPHSPTQESIVQPAKPTGISAVHARYSGRALAEWSLVVGECNGFVDRRREEGVLGLKDVEVPLLGVEGIRKTG
jgi:hypothetical protein